MSAINVRSEIGPLRKVLLHRPGRELLNLTPNTLEALLFDDIPYLEVAQDEHDAFAAALRECQVEVLYLEELMAQVLDAYPELRSMFLKQWIQEGGIRTERYQKIIFDYVDQGYPSNIDLVMKTMEGVNLAELHTDATNSLVDLVSDASKMVIAPMPNLYFTRDPFASIGSGISLNRMRSPARNRETIYAEYLFNYHPDFTGTPRYYSRYNTFHIEGGDILNLTDTLLAIGISQRTEPDAIDQLARMLFEDETSSIRTVLAFRIPCNRAMMHLDTVFTQVDRGLFTVHPGIMGPLTVFEITPRGTDVNVAEVKLPLQQLLQNYLDVPVALVPCGGTDRIAAEREQWNDGSNTLAVRPGTVVVYERNVVTNDLLAQHGVEVLEVPSAELSRGRGGPRCMSMPLAREPLA